jgi:hypothetical protein
MKIGTRSLLFGAHQFLLHPLMLFVAWWRLYGFPADPRLWVAFAVHDWGYWGCPNMDGAEGKNHPELGARIMRRLFGHEWGMFTLLHSRSTARAMSMEPSRLCAADKLATAITPFWAYFPAVILTGEAWEYLEDSRAYLNNPRLTVWQWGQWIRGYFKAEVQRLMQEVA